MCFGTGGHACYENRTYDKPAKGQGPSTSCLASYFSFIKFCTFWMRLSCHCNSIKSASGSWTANVRHCSYSAKTWINAVRSVTSLSWWLSKCRRGTKPSSDSWREWWVTYCSSHTFMLQFRRQVHVHVLSNWETQTGTYVSLDGLQGVSFC